jgi:hypothetical protein
VGVFASTGGDAAGAGVLATTGCDDTGVGVSVITGCGGTDAGVCAACTAMANAGVLSGPGVRA